MFITDSSIITNCYYKVITKIFKIQIIKVKQVDDKQGLFKNTANIPRSCLVTDADIKLI